VQTLHEAPPLPQADFCVPGLHIPFVAQQPVGHDSASQTHAPETQRRPDPQSLPLPQWQTPLLEQLSAVVGSQVTQVPPP
jgi:hypothetical protein